MNSSLYLVTGASGFVGRHLCRALLDSGASVRAIVRKEDDWLSSLGVEVLIGDLSDEASLAASLDGVDYVVHCAANAKFGNGAHYRRQNLELTESVLASVKKFAPKLRRFVFLSTIGAVDRRSGDGCQTPLNETSDAHPSSDYGRSKLAAEQSVASSGVPYSIIRPAMVLGEDMRLDSHFAFFARQAIRRGIFSRIGWPGRFSVVHVDDLARAIFEVAVHPDAEGQVFFCSGYECSIEDCFRLAAAGVWRIPIAPFVKFLAPLLRWAPFSIKALLLPALVASDRKLQGVGWTPLRSTEDTLWSVVSRERMRLDPRVRTDGCTVITGAASGLGRALTDELAPMRTEVLLVDRDRAGLEELVRRHPHCRMHVADLADWDALLAMIDNGDWRGLDVTELYAFAGFGARGTVQALSLAVQRDMFSVNLLARMALARSVVPNMRRRQFGRVVFVSSSSAFQPLPLMASYAASNSGLLALGQAWSYELCVDGVHMMTVCPGGMQTNFQKSAGVKELEGEMLMSPEEAVRLIIQGLRAQKSLLIVSGRAKVMAFLARLLPRSWSLRLWGRLMEKMR